MERRTFLIGGVVGTAALAGGSLLILTTSSEDAIISLIREVFPEIDMPEEDLANFARSARHRLKDRGPFVTLTVQHSSVRWGVNQITERNVNWIPSLIVTDFIRSTNFADPDRGNRPITYLSYADPYAVGCSNPLPMYSGAYLAWPEA